MKRRRPSKRERLEDLLRAAGLDVTGRIIGAQGYWRIAAWEDDTTVCWETHANHNGLGVHVVSYSTMTDWRRQGRHATARSAPSNPSPPDLGRSTPDARLPAP